MTVKQQINDIDRQVTALRAQLLTLEKIDRMSAASWQAAWDKHPELREKETALFRKRGDLQVIVAKSEARIDLIQRGVSRRAEVKAATKSTGVFQYLHDCKRSAELLGISQLEHYYADGLQAWRERTA